MPDGEDDRPRAALHEATDLRRTLEQQACVLEGERAARAAAEHALRSKEQLLATLAHDLRTPLNAVLGWATLLQKQPTPETLAEGLSAIVRNARLQSQLIADMLGDSRRARGDPPAQVTTGQGPDPGPG